MLTKPLIEIFVPGTPGHPGQVASTSCPPPPPPPHGGGPPPPPDTGGGGCQPGAGMCCTISWELDRHGDLVPVVICV
ncbi:MAG TPA: hypothetical protein VLE97_01830 [Gaiellaceae bacterium]|nr:hypothetical protein [Gaiellaceae bacterium]